MTSRSSLPILLIVMEYLLSIWVFVTQIYANIRTSRPITHNPIFRYCRYMLNVWLVAALGYFLLCLYFALLTASLPNSRVYQVLAGLTECARHSNSNKCTSQDYQCAWMQRECWAVGACLSQSKHHIIISEIALELTRQFWDSLYWFISLLSLYTAIIVRVPRDAVAGVLIRSARTTPGTGPGTGPRTDSSTRRRTPRLAPAERDAIARGGLATREIPRIGPNAPITTHFTHSAAEARAREIIRARGNQREARVSTPRDQRSTLAVEEVGAREILRARSPQVTTSIPAAPTQPPIPAPLLPRRPPLDQARRVPLIREDATTGQGISAGMGIPPDPEQTQLLQDIGMRAIRLEGPGHNDQNPNPEGRLRAAAHAGDYRLLLDEAERPFHIVDTSRGHDSSPVQRAWLVSVGIIEPQEPPFQVSEEEEAQVIVRTRAAFNLGQAQRLEEAGLHPYGVSMIGDIDGNLMNDPRPPTGLLNHCPNDQTSGFTDGAGRLFVIRNGEGNVILHAEAAEILGLPDPNQTPRLFTREGAEALPAAHSLMAAVVTESPDPTHPTAFVDLDGRQIEIVDSSQNPAPQEVVEIILDDGESDSSSGSEVAEDQDATTQGPSQPLREVQAPRATQPDISEVLDNPATARVTLEHLRRHRLTVSVWSPPGQYRPLRILPQGLLRVGNPADAPPDAPAHHWVDSPVAEGSQPARPAIFRIMRNRKGGEQELYDLEPQEVLDVLNGPLPGAQATTTDYDEFLEEAGIPDGDNLDQELPVTDAMIDFLTTEEAQAYPLVQDNMYPVPWGSFGELPEPVRLPEGELRIPTEDQLHPFMMLDAAGQHFIVIELRDENHFHVVYPQWVDFVQQNHRGQSPEMLQQAAELPIVDNFLTHYNLVSFTHPDPPQASRAQWPQGELHAVPRNVTLLRDETGLRYTVYYREGHLPWSKPLLSNRQVVQLQAEFLQRQLPGRENS